MRDITIIGAGLAGITLIEKLREKNDRVAITLIDKNTHHFCRKDLILQPGNLSKRFLLKEWAQSKNVQFINDTVERINPRRRKIYLKQEEPKEFDSLVIATGLVSKKLEIKGDHRDGFFYLAGMEPYLLKDLLRISNEACVFISTLLGIKLSLALASLGKEVRAVSADLDFLKQDKESVINLLTQKGISLHLGSFIQEAVGEATVKAVKLSPLKVFSSQLVFIDSTFKPNLDFFEDELVIRDNFFTDHEDVYILGDAGRSDIETEIAFVNNYEEAKTGASSFSDYLLEQKAPVFERKTKSDESIHQAIEALLNENKVVEKI